MTTTTKPKIITTFISQSCLQLYTSMTKNVAASGSTIQSQPNNSQPQRTCNSEEPKKRVCGLWVSELFITVIFLVVCAYDSKKGTRNDLVKRKDMNRTRTNEEKDRWFLKGFFFKTIPLPGFSFQAYSLAVFAAKPYSSMPKTRWQC